MRSSNAFAFVGDSRLSTVLFGMDHYSQIFFNQANATPEMNQRMRVVYNGAIAGARSDVYATQAIIDAAIASPAKWLIIWGIVNDIVASSPGPYTAQQAWDGYNGSPGLKSAADQAIAAGMKVIFVTETGATNYGTSTTKLGEVNKYNRLLREYAEAAEEADLFDINSVVLDPTVTTPTFKTGYSEDGIHLQLLGGYHAGQAFKDMMLPLIPEMKSQSNAIWESVANGGIQQLLNPYFLTTTGGTAYSGVTGSVPANWSVELTGPGSPSVAVSCAANPGGYGNDMVLVCTFGKTDDRVIVTQVLVNANVLFGTILEGGCVMMVDAGSVNFAGGTVYMQANITGSTPTSFMARSLFKQNKGAGPTFGYTEIHRTPKFTYSGTTLSNVKMQIHIYPANVQAGGSTTQTSSGTIRISRTYCRIRNT